jgi:hypothetical protein
MSSNGKQLGNPVVALIVAGAIIIAILIFVLGLIRVGWRVAVLPWAARRRPVVLQKFKRSAETVERFVGPQPPSDWPRMPVTSRSFPRPVEIRPFFQPAGEVRPTPQKSSEPLAWVIK